MERISMRKPIAKNLKLIKAWEDYEKELHVRGLSKFSLITKNSVFKDLMKFCGSKDSKITLTEELKDSVINDYILWCRENKNKNTTINSKLTNLKPFLYWCMEKSYCKEFKVKSVKEGKSIKPTYSIEDLKKVLEKPNIDKCSFAEYRNWVLCNYFLATGNRLNSVVNIKIKDVDFDNNLVTLTETKNKTEQIIPITPHLNQILKEYLIYRKGEPDDYLFINIYGQPLKRTSCQQALIYYIGKQRGVKITSIHAFRRTFATMYVDNGGNIFALQQLMGHEKLETTRKYVNLSIKQLQSNYSKYNPLDSVVNKNKKEKVRISKKK